MPFFPSHNIDGRNHLQDQHRKYLSGLNAEMPWLNSMVMGWGDDYMGGYMHALNIPLFLLLLLLLFKFWWSNRPVYRYKILCGSVPGHTAIHTAQPTNDLVNVRDVNVPLAGWDYLFCSFSGWMDGWVKMCCSHWTSWHLKQLRWPVVIWPGDGAGRAGAGAGAGARPGRGGWCLKGYEKQTEANRLGQSRGMTEIIEQYWVWRRGSLRWYFQIEFFTTYNITLSLLNIVCVDYIHNLFLVFRRK